MAAKTQTPPAKRWGSIFKIKGSNFYYLKYYRHGKPYRESTKTTDLAEAEKMLKQREAEIRTGTFQGLAHEKIKVDELITDLAQEYATAGRSEKTIKGLTQKWEDHLGPFFGGMRVRDLNTDLFKQYRAKRTADGHENATINREFSILRKAMHLGFSSHPQKVKFIPAFNLPRERNARKGFFTPAQVAKLIEYCPETWFVALVTLGFKYGPRVNELLDLKVRHYDPLTRLLTYEDTKNKDDRINKMTPKCHALLVELMRGKSNDDYLISRPNGKPVRDFRGTWHNACTYAKCKGRIFHDLRRSAANEMRALGLSDSIIQDISGWKTQSVFRRYAFVQPKIIDYATRILEMKENEETVPNVTIPPPPDRSKTGQIDINRAKPKTEAIQ